MGTELDIAKAVKDLQTRFDVEWVEMFENPMATGGFALITRNVTTDAKKLDISTFGPGPVVRQWVGSKVYEQFRHYDHEVEVKNYEKSIALSANDVRYDPSGAIARKLNAWFGTAGESDIDKLVHDAIVSNSGTGPTGYDGVTMLSDSHPHLNGGSGHDNLTTSALSFSTYDAGVQAMSSLRDEKDKPMMLFPTLLRVGPKNRKIALEIAKNAERILPVSAAGVEATSTVVSVTTIPNIFQGDNIAVEINNRYVGAYDDYWDLVDASSQDRLPMGWMDNRSPEIISMDDPKDDNRFHRNEYLYSVELDGSAFCGFFPSIYGGRL